MSSTAQGSARERIISLLDENSFVEIGALVTKRSTDFNLLEQEVPSDGVITGYGIIEQKPVYVYSQDISALNGTVGEMHAKKIASLYDIALKVGAPVIGLIDCAGMRLQEATDALAGFGSIYLKQTLASGVIPQISAIFGTCGGGVAVASSLSDFTFMEEKSAKLFVNSPNTLVGNHIVKCDTSSAEYQSKNGMVDFVGTDEIDVINQIRQLIHILPNNNKEYGSIHECNDDLNRELDNIESVIKDAAKVLINMSDHQVFLETKKEFAKEMVTGFIQLNGITVGAIANRSAVLDNDGKVVEALEQSLTTDGCYKAAEFITFCDSFNIPIVTLTNVTGYKATMEEEKTIAKASAKLTYAFANATIPKVNVIVGKAFGSAYITMNSKHIGADLVFALPSSEIGMMDGKNAAEIIYAKELEKEKDKVSFIEKKADAYNQLQSSPVAAAKRGYVDNIIEPESMRKQVIYAFEMLLEKKELRPNKKHGTV